MTGGQAQSVAEALARVEDAVFALDADLRITYCNEAAADFFDAQSETLTGAVVWEHVTGGQSSRFFDAVQQTMSTGEAQTVERLFDAPPRRGRLYPSESGLTVHLEAVDDDGGDDQMLARHERVLEMMGDGVYVVDEEGIFTMVNDAYTEMVGYSREELLGEHVTKVVDEGTRDQAVGLERELQNGEQEPVSMETTIELPDGDSIVAEATFSTMSLADGEHERVAVVRDVTERKNREERIEQHRDVLSNHADRTELVQRIDRAITGATTRAEVYEVVCETLADSRFYQVAWVGDRRDADLHLVAGAGTTDAGLDALVAAAQKEGELGPVERALQRRSIQVQQHIEDEPDDPRYDVFAERGYHSSISLPLVHDGRTFGALTIDSKRTHAFSGSERDLLGTLADTVAFALHTVEERQRYQSVVEDVIDSTLDAGIVVYDDDGRVQWTNERFAAFFGVDPDDVPGHDAASMRTDVLAPALAEELTETAADEWLAETTGEPTVCHLDGEGVPTERFLERRCSTIESGLYACGSVALYYDITDRKRSEQRLAESERRRRALLENLPGMAYRCRNEPGRPMEFVSEGCADLTGYDPQRLEDGAVSWGETVVHPDDRADVLETIKTAVTAGEPFETTYRIRTADGETRWVWEQGREITTVDDRTLLEGFLTDVTERRRQREELRHQHEFNRQLLETSPIPILAFEPDGTLAHANGPAIEALGSSSEDDGAATEYTIAEQPVYDESGSLLPAEQRPVRRTLEAGETVTDEVVQVELADGERRWFSFQSAPVFDEDGAVELAIVACDDITELKSQQAELARLDHINSVIRQLNRSLVESTDQATVRETVCRELAGAGPYGGAWYCDADLATDRLTPVASAGLDADIDDLSFSVGESLAGEALTSGDVVVDELPDHPLADAASREGWTTAPTVAAVPISYGDTHYGVLCLAAGNRSGFSDDIRAVFAELGESIGHALTAIVRKEGLLGDASTRLEFRLRNYFDADDFGTEFDDISFQFDEIIPVGDGTILQYVTATGGSESEVVELIESGDEATEYRRLDDSEEGPLRFEIKQSEQPLIDSLTDLGGRIVSARVEHSDFSLVTEIPTSVDVRTVVERVQEFHPETDLEAQRSVSSPDLSPDLRADRLEDRLTDRQQMVLETAYFSGYFEWPRATTGEEVAASLDLAPSTLSQHLRMGEHKTFELLFDADR